MNQIESYAKTITAIAGATAVIYGAVSFVNNQYVNKTQFKTTITQVNAELFELDKRQKLYELRELLKKALNEMYFYQDLLKKYPENEEIRRKYEEAKDQVEYLREQIRKLEEENPE